MLLYYDNLITDEPLFPGIYNDLDRIRETNTSFRFRNRLEVAKYTLYSYSVIEWSHVIIKYELGKEYAQKDREDFEKFIYNLFPNATIIYGRSDNIKKFRETAEYINSLNDEWVFYAGNNDHPFIAPNLNMLYYCLGFAESLNKDHNKTQEISIIYSHYPEPLHMGRKGNAFHDIGYPSARLIEEFEFLDLVYFPNGYFTSIQIVNKKLFNYWINADIPEDAVIKRIEDVHKYIPLEERRSQWVICPTEELFAHYDGYEHTKGKGYYLPSTLVPPLFIPEGFFKEGIKIRFGYDDYKNGWVNINPMEDFSFNVGSADMKILLDDVPLFWRNRIIKTDMNPYIDLIEMIDSRDSRLEQINNAYLLLEETNPIFYYLYVKYYKVKNILNSIKSDPKKILIKLKEKLR